MTAPGLPASLQAAALAAGGARIQDHVADGEDSFITLFDCAPVPMSCSIIDADCEPLKTFWNQAWFAAFGYREDEVQGKSGLLFGLWLSQEQRRTLLSRSGRQAGQRIESVEAELKHGDGSLRQAIVSARRIDIDAQSWLILTYQDVTAQRRIDRALREAQARLLEFGEMVESSNDAMMLVEDYRIIECNPAAQRLFALPREQLIGRHPADLSPDRQHDGGESRVLARQRMDAAMAGTMQRFLWRHHRADGSEFTSEVMLNPSRSSVSADDSGRRRYVSVIRDVTEAQLAADAQRESELRFRQLFELAPIPLALFSPDGRIGAINRQCTQLFGYAHADIPDITRWGELAYPDPQYRAEVRAMWEKSLASMANDGEWKPIEVTIRCRNGDDRAVLIGNAAISGSLLASFYDITERRAVLAQLETLNETLESRVEERTHALQSAIEDLRRTQDELVRAEKLAGLGSLVAGIAHELNTPIGNAVMVASTMSDHCREFAAAIDSGLRRSVLDRFVADWRESTQVIERNLLRAAELISSFKQVAVDQSSYQRRPFELAEVLHELKLTLSPMLRRSRVTLTDDIDPGIRMDSYPGPLTQVLMNIVNNAVVHAFDGLYSGRMTISGRLLPNARVSISVSDDGVGIEAKHLPRIFDPFFTTKLGRGGSGLGLHIVYTLVRELLGGTVRIESQLGEGCTAIIELPLRAPLEISAQLPERVTS